MMEGDLMKIPFLFLLILAPASVFAQSETRCTQAVLAQARVHLEGEIYVQDVQVLEVSSLKGLGNFTLQISSTTNSGETKIREIMDAQVDRKCRILEMKPRPGSLSYEE